MLLIGSSVPDKTATRGLEMPTFFANAKKRFADQSLATFWNHQLSGDETDFVANTPDFQELIRDIAMHIAAAKPRFATRAEVTQETLDKEKEIFAHQAIESGKPENIIEKIVSGKMQKFYEENCVLEQPFIKDTNITIQELIKQKIALLGENINIGKFARFEI